jgi:hypothetical protein
MQKAIRKRKEIKERKGKTVRERMKRKGSFGVWRRSGVEDRRRLVKHGTELMKSVI